VTYRIEEVHVDGNGIQDRSGKSWRFDITGEGAAARLRSWKSGSLFR
jgi:hypothetical protein